ncbi:hypothetical protein A2592_00300 [Candidatus Kaiserbacteria bacterium RIFOXYD1_FULL_42_15]|uniref:Uncharacterized protein n=1 Tax=Candidatus Kaiserbacteria bacterium RIFOXYD1_FULL_42_15 TaxID=1798532 RepID=A0A1F6FRT7_9BACT|nr:MAG: hypothetical protein A2592_00300 [Candidatus Kaiserbacteria bacterium RIFOXYD1_FULL_42_15]
MWLRKAFYTEAVHLVALFTKELATSCESPPDFLTQTFRTREDGASGAVRRKTLGFSSLREVKRSVTTKQSRKYVLDCFFSPKIFQCREKTNLTVKRKICL